MATCSRASTMSSLFGVVAIGPKDLYSLIFRILPKLFDLPISLMKKFRKGKHFHLPLMERETVVGTLPELTQDVLMDIFATLEVPDLIRAGSVCSSWYSAYTCLRNLGEYKQSQTPCLLYTSRSAGENVAFLYSLVENRAYKLTLPEPPIRRRFLIGSSNGWLITADERSELHLVNPITSEQVALPSVITIEQVKPITDVFGTILKYELSWYYREKLYQESYALNKLREKLYFKAFVFPDPCSQSYFVVLIHEPYFQLSFARAGDDKWTWLPQNTQYRDCMYKDGLLYALTAHGEIDAFDLTASTITMKVIVDKIQQYIFACKSWYIIWAPWGCLLQVWRTFSVPEQEDVDEDGDAPENGPIMNRPCSRTTKVTVYEVDLKEKELVETKRLSNHILFIGHNNSLCLGADEHPELKANHAYYTDDRSEPVVALKSVPRDIGVVDLENSSRKKIASKIWSDWPCPTWITPNLTKMNLAFSK